jgi:hypothetical protein
MNVFTSKPAKYIALAISFELLFSRIIAAFGLATSVEITGSSGKWLRIVKG